MTEIALTTFALLCAAGILENTLYISGVLHSSRYSDSQHGIGIVLDIAWILICLVALYVGGAFASAAITVATVWVILGIIGDLSDCAKYRCISDAIGLAIHTLLLILLLTAGE